MQKYCISWLFLNKSIFYHYFYVKSEVKEKLNMLDKVNLSVFPLVEDLHFMNSGR